eukprot:12843680-Heterocapsa_arctica.AAC.1
MGAIRLKLEEAKEAITEQLHFGTHYMDSPRTKSDRNSESVRSERQIQRTRKREQVSSSSREATSGTQRPSSTR